MLTPTPLQARTPAEAPVLPATPVAPAAPVVAGAGQSMPELIEQVAGLAQRLAGLRAQRSVLQRQIERSTDAATRAALELRRVPLDNQIAQTELDLANVRAQLESRRSTSTGVAPMPPMGHREFDPDLVVGLMFAFIFAVLMPISIAIARRIWRGRRDTGPIIEDRVSPRLERLEQAVDAIAIEVERISEGQRFVTKVLVDRPGSANNTSSAEAGESNALGEGKPLRALGAGAAEPVRVSERQAVKQQVTPR